VFVSDGIPGNIAGKQTDDMQISVHAGKTVVCMEAISGNYLHNT